MHQMLANQFFTDFSLSFHFIGSILLELLENRIDSSQTGRIQNCLYGSLPADDGIREAHTVCRKYTGTGMNQYAFHRQCICDQTGMLAPGPTETTKRIFCDVIAALNRNLFHRVGHILHRDRQIARRDLFWLSSVAGCLFDFPRKIAKFSRYRFPVQGLVGFRPEYRRKKFGLQLSQHDIAVRHG